MEREGKALYRRIAIRSAVIVGTVVLTLTLGVWLLGLLLPFLLAYLFAWMLHPVVGAVCRRTRLPRRPVAFALVALGFAAAFALLGFLVYLAVTEIIGLANGYQELIGQAERVISALRARIVLPFGGTVMQQNLDALIEAAHATVISLLEPLSQWLISLATAAAKLAPTALLFVIALVMGSYFILSDFDGLHDQLGRALEGEQFRPLLRVLAVLRQAFGGYLMASLALAVMVSLIDLAGLLLARVQYAALLALFMGVLDFLPYVGSGAVLIPWAIACFYTGRYLRGLYLVLLYLVVFLARNVVGRRLLGTRFRRSPFFGLVCAFIGWKLWGVAGLILGPVLCMLAANVCSGGLLDRTAADFRLLFADLRARLSGRAGSDDTG